MAKRIVENTNVRQVLLFDYDLYQGKGPLLAYRQLPRPTPVFIGIGMSKNVGITSSIHVTRAQTLPRIVF